MAGRPSEFTEETAERICEEIALGRSLLKICEGEEFPAQSTVYKWLIEFPTFAEKYARARERQADAFFEIISEIANDGAKDWVESKFGPISDQEHIARSRLRVDTLKWQASKLAPKKYGDKLAHTGEDGGAIQFVVTRSGAREK